MPALFIVGDRGLEPLHSKREAVHRHDLLPAYGARFEHRPIPGHSRDLTGATDCGAERETHLRRVPFGGAEEVRRRVVEHELVAAARDSVEWRAGTVPVETRPEERRPIVRRNAVQRLHYIVELIRNRHGTAVVDAEERAGEIVQRLLSVRTLTDQR